MTEASIFQEFFDCLLRPIRYDSFKAFSWSNLGDITLLHFMVFIPVTLLFVLLSSLMGIEELPHAMDDLIDSMPFYLIFGFAVIFAPILEELIFRFPLKYSITSRVSLNRVFFYGIAILFAGVHIFNFADVPFFWMIPLLVLPQFGLALVLGFVRLRFGMWANIYVHMLNNLLPMVLLFFFKDQMM